VKLALSSEKQDMKAPWMIGLLLGALVASASAAQKDSKGAASDAGHKSAPAPAKDQEPFPQVPRIEAEEVQKLAKDGKVVLVDTDDSEAYAAEHIKGAVNVAFDPTADARAQDETLSALPGDRMIVFYCNCPHEEDSAPFVLEMWDLGYDRAKVKALKGGLSRWEHLGYPLVGTDVDVKQARAN